MKRVLLVFLFCFFSCNLFAEAGDVKPTDVLKTCLKKVKAGEDIGCELKILKEHLWGWNIIISLATIEQNKQAIEVLNSIEKELREKADKENVDAVCDYVAFLKQKADFISFYAQRRLNTHLKEKHSARAFLCSYRLFKNDQDAKHIELLINARDLKQGKYSIEACKELFLISYYDAMEGKEIKENTKLILENINFLKENYPEEMVLIFDVLALSILKKILPVTKFEELETLFAKFELKDKAKFYKDKLEKVEESKRSNSIYNLKNFGE